MPTFSYKGYDFEVDHTPTSEEFAKMSAYVDTLPPKESKETSMLDKALGVGEAALNTLTGLTTGGVAGTIGGLQEFINKGVQGKLPKPSELENKFMEQADLATYQPRTKTGQQYSEQVGKLLQEAIPLTPLMNEIGIAGRLAKPAMQQVRANAVAKPTEAPAISQAAASILEKRKTASPVPQERPTTGVQQELDLGQPNQFGMRPSEFVVDENGIPIRRDASIEAQTTARQGDLFSPENMKQESFNEAVNRWEQPEEVRGVTPDRGYLKQQEIEQAYLEKAKQDQMSVEESIQQPSQSSRNLGETGFGKGQRGALDWDAFTSIVPKFKGSLLEAIPLYHGTKKVFSKLAASEEGGALGNGVYLTPNPKFAGEYAKGSGGNIHQVYADVKNPLILEGTYADPMVEALVKLGTPEKLANNIVERAYDRNGYITTEVQSRAKKAGYDGIIQYKEGDLGEVVAFSPEQVESAISPKLGQTSFGKSQRGSIGFFNKKEPQTLESFSEQIKREVPDATPEELRSAWEEQRGKQHQQSVAKAVGGINKKLKENLSIYRDVSKEDALASIKSSPDNDTSNLGFMKNQIFARGRLGAEKLKNEGLKSGLAYMIGLRDKGRITANNVLHGDEGILTQLRKQETLMGEGKAGDVLAQRMEAQFNPEYKFNFTPEQAKINQKIDAVFENIRKQMEELTGKPIHQVPNYFPSMFYGPFAVEVRDAAGRLVAYVTEKTAKNASKAAQEVLGELGEGFSMSEPKYRKEITSESFKNRAGLAPYFEAMIDLLQSDDPIVLKAQESVQRVIAKRAMDTRQMQNRLKYKAGVVGAEGQKSWKSPKENYFDAKDVLENYIRGFEDWKANMESAKFLNEVKDSTGPSNTYNVMQSYFDDIRGVTEHPSKIVKDLENSLAKSGYDLSGEATSGARKTASGVTKLWLGFWNPNAMAQNVLQPVHALPKLVELASLGGSKDIISPVIIGFAKGLKDSLDLATNKLTGRELQGRVKFLRDLEVIKPGLVESSDKTKVGHFFEKGVVSGGLLASEAVARATTYNIFEAYLRNSGYSLEEARTLAKNLTHDYQVNYENYARPGMLANTGVVGELGGRLQSFKVNQLTQLANYIQEAKSSKNPAALLTFLAVSIGMAGVQGMIGMDVAEGIYGGMVNAGLIDPDTPSPRQMALDLGGAAATGLPTAATGKWLSGSLTSNLVGDMSWRNVAPIFAGVFDIGTKVPIAYKVGKDVVTGHKTVPESEKAQLALAVAPATIRGVLEDRFLTDPQGRVSSQYTGQTTYVQGEQDKDLLSRFTNMRSKQRGETLARAALSKQQETRINEAIDSKIERLSKLVDESVRMGKPLDDQYMGQEIQRIIDLGGDPKRTIAKINSFIVQNQLGNWFERQYKSGRFNLGNINRKLRAMEQQEKVQQ